MPTAVASLRRSISPPAKKRRTSPDDRSVSVAVPTEQPSLAAIEAGEAKIQGHVDYFAKHLSAAARPIERGSARLTIDDFIRLYQRNDHEHGRHFVIHQHNHPIAGVHYDLRLQFSATSTCSWAIPYGLPGSAGSRRPGRMAIETRVHNLWNNLIESASHATGSLLIWDTGEYEILPRKTTNADVLTDDEADVGTKQLPAATSSRDDDQKLIDAFQTRYIRLRLHGARLPQGYTVTLRLPLGNDTIGAQPKAPSHKRRRRRVQGSSQSQARTSNCSDTDTDVEAGKHTAPSTVRTELGADDSPAIADELANDAALASEDDDEIEAETIRANNAYTGAHNTIGSIHQRHWYLSLDKRNSGFVQRGGRWVRDGDAGFEPFYVQGVNVERSVVTGRLCSEVMADEGVQGFKPRKMWRPVME